MAPSSRNPIGFTPLPVTIYATALYVALFALLLVTHHTLPSAPSNVSPREWPGVNLTEAWLDLEHLSRDYHPFISKSNQNVRTWLLERVHNILHANKVDWDSASPDESSASPRHASVTVFDDTLSNITYAYSKQWITYFEGENIMVYIRGSDDQPGRWWESGKPYDGPGGVLVNAHYDSVSTGFGATDDGVGVVTVLQLLSHFTTRDRQPTKGILLLLNNGEEDGLHGASAFTQHLLSRFPHAFLNLEGAGAGGRATLFRSTDTEVTRFYAQSKYPFGSVISGDGFKRGLVRSGTDYSVFTQDLGMRGLDVAFMEPRARYHTVEDDARDTSIESVWHMLSASLATVHALSHDTSSTFDGASPSDDGKINAGQGSNGVWFDLFGRAFAVFQLHTLFALSVTLLVVGPILLVLLEVTIRKSGKWYLFSRKQFLHSSDDDEPVRMYGWRGFFRFPMAFVVASAAVVALSYLFTKESPYIMYSSPYSVWSCMLAAWLSVSWFVLRLGDSVRPSALSRLYTLIWLYVLTWAALVAVTVAEDQLHLGSGYFIVIYNAAVFVALLISYLELFALPKKTVYAQHAFYGPEADTSPTRTASLLSATINHSDDPPRGREGAATNATEDDDATERTSLLNSRQTFTRYGRDRRRSEQTDLDTLALQQDPLTSKAYGGEQAWSSSLPRWTWVLQLIVLIPINIILVGQVGLLATSALHQTPADGNAVFTIYLVVAAISTLLVLPLTPFLHRMTYHVPTFVFLVCVGTLFYNVFAFPFSRDHRLKVYFYSQIDLDTGSYKAALTGLQPYTSDIVAQLPSAAGQQIDCGHTDWAERNGLENCVWNGLGPHVVPASYSPEPNVPYPNHTISRQQYGVAKRSNQQAGPSAQHTDWLNFNITRPESNATFGEYIFDIQVANTRACRLYLESPISNLTIEGAGSTGQGFVPSDDSDASHSQTQIKLWSRTWDAVWRVRVSLPSQSSGARSSSSSSSRVTGKVLCIWADANQEGTIPALDEIKHYMPVWSTVSKGTDGLVEGYKTFKL